MNPSLLPDHGGLIQEIAICLPSSLFAPKGRDKLQALQNLAEALAKGTKLVILIEQASRDIAVAWLAGQHLAAVPQLLATPAGTAMRDFDFWIQDPFLAATGNGGLALLPLPTTDRPSAHAAWLAEAGYRLGEAPSLHLTGGNHLCGDDYRLIGGGSVIQSMRNSDMLPFDAAITKHAALDRRRLHVFGFPLVQRGQPTVLAQQPHHIDLVLSLTGQRDDRGRPIVLLADPRAGTSLDAPAVPGLEGQLAASASRLTADGFSVRRNPVPYIAHPQWSPNPTLRAYNNVIVENAVRDGRSRPLVWLPHFGDLEPALADFDRANRHIWEDFGFEPVPVYGCSALARNGGAIRCASKVLQRGRTPLA